MEEHKRLELIQAEVENGFIRRQYSEDGRLAIFCYTQKCEVGGDWSYPRNICRGLVLDSTGKTVIKCVPKFFNAEQVPETSLENIKNKMAQADKVYYTEKNDGYLIQIKNDTQYGFVVTSKGSFVSKYADFVRDLLKEKQSEFEPNVTYICELCHTFAGDEGIIVTKHEGTTLWLWECYDENGQSILQDFYDGRRETPSAFKLTQRFSEEEYKQYMKRNDVEGVVIVIVKGEENFRVKHKTPIYLEKHRIAANCTEKRAFELFCQNVKIADLDIPDEFRAKMENWTAKFIEQFNTESKRVVHLVSLCRLLTDKGVALNTSLGLTRYEKNLVLTMRKKPQRINEVIIKHMKQERKNLL